MTSQPPEDAPGRALAIALGAMLAVALLVVLVVGGALLGAVRLSGLGGAAPGEASDAPGLVVPEPTTDATSGPEATESSTPPRPAPAIRLSATPASVAAGERITLSGDYPGGDGATLQVQRKDGQTWVDFPVEASVSGGSFSTWVQTTRTGQSVFRVLDEGTGQGSNEATVDVG